MQKASVACGMNKVLFFGYLSCTSDPDKAQGAEEECRRRNRPIPTGLSILAPDRRLLSLLDDDIRRRSIRLHQGTRGEPNYNVE